MSHDSFLQAYFCTDCRSDWAGPHVAHSGSMKWNGYSGVIMWGDSKCSTGKWRTKRFRFL